MSVVRDHILQLWEHMFASDDAVVAAVAGQRGSPAYAVREAAHILGAEETWLARIEGRPSRAAVWPQVTVDELGPLLAHTHEGCRTYLDSLAESEIGRMVTYVNSAGREFSNEVGDILLTVVLHGQYHRGKVNLLLRQAGLDPVPVDYIAWVRGVPAATEADAAGLRQGGVE